MEQEVAVEDAAWVVVAVAVAAVEEDVVAEASDQPTLKARTKNNHCLEAISTRIQICPGTSRRLNSHSHHQLCPEFAQAGYQQRLCQSTKTLCRRSKPGDCRQKENLIKEPLNQCISKVVASFTFMSFRKKKCNLFYDQDPMGPFLLSCLNLY